MTDSFSGDELREHNEKIVKCIKELRAQRDELNFLIERQREEKQKLQVEHERIAYKLTLITKSLSRRLETLTDYDNTIKEAEEEYKRLVNNSGQLLGSMQKEAQHLEDMMDKRVGTESFMP